MLHTSTTRSQSGFSLVELSIVMVILGLLVAGVIAGSALVRNAQLRAVSTEFNNFRTNLNTFKGIYDALPGDMANAHEFWAIAECSSATNAAMDGDGNGQILWDSAATNNESYMMWCHMRLAGMANGVFDGVPASQTAPVLGTEIPRSKLDGGGYIVSYGVHSLPGTNVLVLGGFSGITVDATLVIGKLLTPRDARNLDTKIDDGLPRFGIVRGFDGDDVDAAEDCVEVGGAGTTDDIYNVILDPQPVGCGLAFSLS